MLPSETGLKYAENIQMKDRRLSITQIKYVKPLSGKASIEQNILALLYKMMCVGEKSCKCPSSPSYNRQRYIPSFFSWCKQLASVINWKEKVAQLNFFPLLRSVYELPSKNVHNIRRKKVRLAHNCRNIRGHFQLKTLEETCCQALQFSHCKNRH